MFTLWRNERNKSFLGDTVWAGLGLFSLTLQPNGQISVILNPSKAKFEQFVGSYLPNSGDAAKILYVNVNHN